MLVVAWAGAALGGVLSFASHTRGTRIARGALYIILGWVSVFGAPQLVSDLSAGNSARRRTGGWGLTAGASFSPTNWPNPSPRVFGYPEVGPFSLGAGWAGNSTTERTRDEPPFPKTPSDSLIQ